MVLKEISILNYKNIREATLRFSDKLNCFVGLNGQGKTNLLDAIYYLSFTKSAYNAIDSQNITHNEDMAMIQGKYVFDNSPTKEETISCGIKRGVKSNSVVAKKTTNASLNISDSFRWLWSVRRIANSSAKVAMSADVSWTA